MNEGSYWYGIDGERHGPVSFAEIQELVRSGKLRPTDYIWNERYRVWTRVTDFRGLMDNVSADAARFTDSAATPPKDGAFDGAPPRQNRDSLGSSDEDFVEYAGFWIRAGAYIIDSLVVGFFTMIWFFIAAQMGLFDQFMALESHAESMSFREIWSSMPMAYYVGSYIIVWLYEALLLSSSWKATVGKRAMGIQVVNHEGGRCSFWQASVRSWVKYLISGIFFFGYLLVLFDERKQALHDLAAHTYCEKI